MARGRPRQFPNKEYVNISFRKRKDDYLDVLEIKSRYDEKLGNNRAHSCKKLGVVPKNHADWEKEIIRAGTPEMAEFTRKARMRRWPDKLKKEAPEAISQTASQIPDERQEAKVVFPMRIVVMVILMAAMTGVTSSYKIAEFWKTFRPIFEIIFPGFPKEDISHDTIRRVIQILGRSDNEKFILGLTGPLIKEGQRRQIVIDGQAVNASEIEGSKPYLFNVYDVTNGMVLSQKLIGAKKNEISECVNLVCSLDLRGCVLTADALNTQKKLTEELITNKKCDYCLALKENHKGIYGEVKTLFDLESGVQKRKGHPGAKIWESKTLEAVDKAHGRYEERKVRVLPANLLDKSTLTGWEGLEMGILVEATTTGTVTKTGATSTEKRYFISSLDSQVANIAQDIMTIIRNHWGIENKLHWVLDTTFLQDRLQCTNAEYLVGRALILKVANNWLTAFQLNESKDPERRASKEQWKVRCMDIKKTWERICKLL